MISHIAAGVLILLMFGMGLGLTIGDFRRVVEVPRAALVGLFGQLILLPLVGFSLCVALQLEWQIAMGIMLLTLCPGGVLSNLFTLLARGDVALSVSMTSISSLLTVFTLPLVLNFSMLFFGDANAHVSLPLVKTALQIMLITILPVSLGMFVLHHLPNFALAAMRWIRRGGMLFLPLVIVGVLLQNEGIWFSHFVKLGALTVLLNLLTVLLGFGLGKLARLDDKQVRTLSIEVGAQNAMLGVTVAISPFLLDNAQIAIVPSLYAVTMVAILSIYAAWVNHRDKRAAA